MTEAQITPTQRVQQWLDGFNETLQSDNPGQAAELFEQDGFWRDLVAMTWNIKTMEGHENIRDMLEHTTGQARPDKKPPNKTVLPKPGLPSKPKTRWAKAMSACVTVLHGRS